MEKKMKNIKYIVIVIMIVGVFLLQVNLGKSNKSIQKEDINLDNNGNQIIDNEGKSNQDDETIKGQIDESTLSEEELKDYRNYDPLGKKANGQETKGKE